MKGGKYLCAENAENAHAHIHIRTRAHSMDARNHKHIHTQTRTHTHTHTHTQTHTHAHTNAHIHSCMHTHTHTHIHTDGEGHTYNTHKNVNVLAKIHARTHIPVQKFRHARGHTHKCTHPRMRRHADTHTMSLKWKNQKKPVSYGHCIYTKMKLDSDTASTQQAWFVAISSNYKRKKNVVSQIIIHWNVVEKWTNKKKNHRQACTLQQTSNILEAERACCVVHWSKYKDKNWSVESGSDFDKVVCSRLLMLRALGATQSCSSIRIYSNQCVVLCHGRFHIVRSGVHTFSQLSSNRNCGVTVPAHRTLITRNHISMCTHNPCVK